MAPGCYNKFMTVISLLVALVLALTLHEFAHALVGDWLGDDTARRQGRLTLNPAAHIDPFTTLALPLLLILVGSPVIFGAAKPVPFNPWSLRWGRTGAALVAAAGPLTNLLLAVIFGLYLRWVPIGVTGYQFLGAIVTVNAAFFIFNSIPFPPLDGSRVLYAVAPHGLRQVMDRIEEAGMVPMLAVLLVGFLFLAPFIARMVGGLVNFLVPGAGLP